MLPGRLLAVAIAGAGVLAVTLSALAPAQEATSPLAERLSCVAPTDAAGIDRVLLAADSPLAGEGASFVDAAAAVGLDPRALLAIAAHETLLSTYGPAQAIRNPFGLGPGWSFASERAAIGTTARVLADGYLSEGRTTIASIGARWAPIGAANDPAGLNEHWATGVATYYAKLGGDPARPLLVATQSARPDCGRAWSGRGDEAGPPVVTAWGGAVPAIASPAARDGGDPRTGTAATLAGFVFPLALAPAAPAMLESALAGDAVTIESAPGAPAVASIAGTLRAPTVAEREQGVAFWIVSGPDRLGYGPLAAYEPGILDGVAVTAGRPLGTSAGRVLIVWERDGDEINPYPMLEATRSPR